MSAIRPPELLDFQLHRHPQMPDWTLLDVRFRRHETQPHASPGWIVLACPDGLEYFETPEQSGPVAPGTLLLLPPELIHRDKAGWDAPCRIRVAYLPAQALPQAGFLQLLDRERLQIFMDWCDRFAAGEAAAGLQASLMQQFAGLLPPARRAETPAAIPTLEELARGQGLSKAAALRAFRRIWGCSPDQYRRQLQLRQAADLILEGAPLAEAALTAGFWDQSHFHRHFLGIYGSTPASFRRRNNVQDTERPSLPD